jgi:outer membrane lipoprotein-sorting protein
MADDKIEKMVERLAAKPREAADRATLERAMAAFGKLWTANQLERRADVYQRGIFRFFWCIIGIVSISVMAIVLSLRNIIWWGILGALVAGVVTTSLGILFDLWKLDRLRKAPGKWGQTPFTGALEEFTRFMRRPFMRVAMMAYVVVMAAYVVHLSGGRVDGTSVAFAKTLAQIQKHSYRCKLSVQTIDDGKATSLSGAEVAVWEPGRVRVDSSSSIGNVSSVSDLDSGKVLLLFHDNKVGMMFENQQARDLIGKEGIFTLFTRPVENLWNIRNGSEKELGKKVVGGRDALGYRVVQGDKVCWYDMTIWADAVSGEPIVVEVLATPKTENGQYRLTLKDFQINPQLAHESFSFDMPAGYTLAYQKDLKDLEGGRVASVEGAKVENMLKLWGEGKKDDAVAALLTVNWGKPIIFGSMAYVFDMTEQEYISLKVEDQQKVLDSSLAQVKGIVKEVYARGMQAVGEKDYREAEKYFQSAVMLGRMLNHEKRQVMIVRLVGIAIEKKILKGMIELYSQSGDEKKLGDVKVELAKVDAQAAEIKNKVEGRQSDATKPADANSPADVNSAAAVNRAAPAIADANMQTMVVRVVAGQSGSPLKDAKVTARCKELELNERTGEDGRALIRVPNSGKTLGLYASCSGYTGQERAFKRAMGRQLPAEYVFELDEGSTIGGSVKNPEGEPVENVAVSIYVHSDPAVNSSEQALVHVQETVRTDNAGRWTFSGVPEEITNLSVRFDHPLYHGAGGRMGGQQSSDLLARSLEIVLQRGIDIRGVVRRTDGTPVKGATVINGTYPDVVESLKATTDAEGRFRFGNGYPSEETFTVYADGLAPEQKVANIVEGGIDLDIVMHAASALRGIVVDEAGKPLKDVTISIPKWRDGSALSMLRTVTNELGRFELAGLPADELELRLSKNGITEKTIGGILADGKDKTLVLGAGVRARGKVIDAVTGLPVRGFKLIPGLGMEMGQGIVWQDSADWVRAYQDGQYEYVFPMVGTEHAVKVEAAGYESAISRSWAHGEALTICDFALKRTSRIEGKVLDPNGRPARGARVLLGSQWGVVMEGGKLTNEGDGLPYPIATTDPNGGFSLTEPNYPYTVVAIADAGSWGVSAEAFKRAPAIRLKPWGRIEGRYLVGTKPGAAKQVEVGPEGSREQRGFITARFKRLTDSAGRFTIEQVVPGKVWVDRVPVEVLPGQTAQVTLGGHGRTVIATLNLPPDIRRMENVSIECWVDPSNVEEWWDWSGTIPWPAGADAMTSGQLWKWVGDFRDTSEGKEWGAARTATYHRLRPYIGRVKGNSLTIEDVNEGKYVLAATIASTQGDGEPNYNDADGVLATARAELEVPPVLPQDLDKPLDIGSLQVTRRPQPGDPAPAIEVEGLGSDKVRLADYRGKVVLLALYSSQDFNDPNDDYHPRWVEFKKACETFAGRDGLSIVAISLERRGNQIVMAAIREMSPKVIHGFAGDQRLAVYGAFCMEYTPRIVLIDRDGKIIANGISGERLAKKLEEVLAQKQYDRP